MAVPYPQAGAAEWRESEASRLSEGSEYRLSLAEGSVPRGRRGGLAINRSFARRPSELIHLDGADCAFAAARSNSSSPVIKDRERPSSAFVHRDATRERFQWWIETPSQRMRKPAALAPSIGRQEVSDEFPRQGRCRQAAHSCPALGERPTTPGRSAPS